MTPFMGTHLSKLDAKGRTSVPAGFRTRLRAGGTDGSLVLRPSHQFTCLEAWPMAGFEALAAPLAQMPAFSAERANFAATLYGEAVSLEPDADGRLVLPANLIAYAQLTDKIAFIGVGDHFLLWEPEAGEAYKRAGRARTLEAGTTLAGVPTSSPASPGLATP